ncbi:tRNA (guanosine(37)-N1)-methyltransferase TrmD [Enterobacteriaceae endosymbiont of Donacia bicoloricornis]|uniref:tRNA (guanosine(37)-N1)-methyltransferase TrmD n=1 Tax=Enterobacteriaceae endosymbiont of Donacia bicoloricornis TaxID=2675772 RepID=UPI001449A723|nr:tRNA (guanosine(37)-N1)-methyltransferase TrmD [Enterobacteriaceae endosymbiont of Donacia bicoloricornis]QJC37905.1 tRNA (guanosine(37)-N1)-methyltransferase TrmD [Enterobacteriaceae endosymbiont of Donacia bicoloricornis]
MWISIITLFPEMFKTVIKYGLINKSIKKKLLNISFWNPRDFIRNKFNKIDSNIYGGGGGVILKAEPLIKSIYKAKLEMKKNVKIIYLSPQGKQINISYIKKLISYHQMIFICGRYKGIDERVIDNFVDEEISIGDYILSGGELPAMVLLDILVRQIPGVLNNISSCNTDSFFNNGLLDAPNYTNPKILTNLKKKNIVPSILLSGDHKKIKEWKLQQSLGITWIKRPDLFKKKKLTKKEKVLFQNFKKSYLKNK